MAKNYRTAAIQFTSEEHDEIDLAVMKLPNISKHRFMREALLKAAREINKKEE